ncbi:hypothetical protein [Acrocarpospora corrugata]|uniref:hypothetical protein n=1 Tax=Acrocarpospora corrugata TaxID=35763 RepID=UPI0012D2A224|nr:hypothetical protein [Acrocarpospora corrugata]
MDIGIPDQEVLAVYAALLCTAAYSCAQNGQRAQALDLIGEAERPPPGCPPVTAAAGCPRPRTSASTASVFTLFSANRASLSTMLAR